MTNFNSTSDLTSNFLRASRLSVPAGYVLLALVVFIPLYFYGKLPETIPLVFNPSGEPEILVNKKVILLISPLAVFVSFVMTLIPRLNSNYSYPVTITKENEIVQQELSLALLRIMRAVLLFVFLLIEIQIIQAVLERKIFLSQYGIIMYLVIIVIPVIFYFVVSKNEQ